MVPSAGFWSRKPTGTPVRVPSNESETLACRSTGSPGTTVESWGPINKRPALLPGPTSLATRVGGTLLPGVTVIVSDTTYQVYPWPLTVTPSAKVSLACLRGTSITTASESLVYGKPPNP